LPFLIASLSLSLSFLCFFASQYPVLFLKNPFGITHPFDPIVIPETPSDDTAPAQVDYECELAIVIGKTAKVSSALFLFSPSLFFFLLTSVLFSFLSLSLRFLWCLSAFLLFCFVLTDCEQDVKKEDALSYVAGYTCANDVTCRRWQFISGPNTQVETSSCYSSLTSVLFSCLLLFLSFFFPFTLFLLFHFLLSFSLLSLISVESRKVL
jgi:hypothetical protein